MIKTFRETITSLQDKHYGSTIIERPMGQTLWYWTQYFLLITVVTAIIIIALVTYFVPQLPRLLRQNLPDASFAVKNGHFSTSLKEPVILGSSDFPVIIDTHATDSAALDKSQNGILILSEKIIVKQDTSDIQTESLSKFPDFYLEKNSLISWITQYQISLWLGLVLAILIISLITSAFFWSGRMIGFAVWGVGFWLLAKVIKRRITYPQAFKLVIYASVLPFLLGAFLILAPNQFLSLLNLGVFLYFGLSWLINLPSKRK